VNYITGQRAVSRELFLSIPGIAASRYGVETKITRAVKRRRLPVVHVTMRGVTHVMKEEKLGFARGVAARARMYSEIARILLNGREPDQD
jgi:hypothetical protein